jgi:hypothetical protein
MTRRDPPRSKTPTETLIKCILVNPLSVRRADRVFLFQRPPTPDSRFTRWLSDDGLTGSDPPWTKERDGSPPHGDSAAGGSRDMQGIG